MYTRKNRRGGGLFNFFSGKPTANSAVSNLKAKRNYNLAHSKSRVANVLATPGKFSYTNKQAIEERYQKAVNELKKLERPQETVSALQQLSGSLDRALSSSAARETGAVVITIPVGVAQLAFKALRLFISALILVFIDLPLGFMSGSMAVNLAAGVAPNRGFNTTRSAYAQARKLTGANQTPAVKNF
jgi:hypothetical protein